MLFQLRNPRFFVPVILVALLAASTADRTMPAAAQTSTAVSRQAAAAPGVAPAEQPRRGGILVTTHRGNPPTWDINDSATIDTYATVLPAFNSLFKMKHPDYLEVEGDLVKTWEVSQGGTVWKLTLHPNVVDHEGNAFTSADAKFVLERLASGKVAQSSFFKGLFKSIETPSPTTVILRLTAPRAAFLNQLGQNAAIVMYTEKAFKSRDFKKASVGTGPYKLHEFVPGEVIRFRRHPRYFKPGLPYLDGVDIILIKDTAARLAAFEARRIHMVRMGSSHGFEGGTIKNLVQRNPQAESYRALHTYGQGLTFNLGRTDSPFHDKRVRMAVHLAMDRHSAVEAIPEAVFGGFGPPTGVFNIPLDQLQKTPPYDRSKLAERRARAKQLLAEAGYPKGFTISMLTRDNVQDKDYTATFAAAQLAEIGITGKLDVQETAVWVSRMDKGEFFVETSALAGGSLTDPDVYSRFICNGPDNRSRYCNPEFDRLFKLQTSELDPVKRNNLARRLEAILDEDVPGVPIWWVGRLALYWKDVVGSPPLEKASGQYTNGNRWEHSYLLR